MIGASIVSMTAEVAALRPPPAMKIWLVVLVWLALEVMTSALPVVLPIV
jgi:hypothetical protein